MSEIEAKMPTEVRPWGAFFVIEEGTDYKVKRITVKPKGQLSLQSHSHRAEHWTVVQGEATATVGGTVRRLVRGDSIDIPRGAIHRLENFGSAELQVIEVQFGQYLGEDDITRYNDIYGRR